MCACNFIQLSVTLTSQCNNFFKKSMFLCVFWLNVAFIEDHHSQFHNTIHNAFKNKCVIVFEMVQRMKKLIMHEMKNDNPILKMNSHTKLILISPKTLSSWKSLGLCCLKFSIFSLSHLSSLIMKDFSSFIFNNMGHH